MTSWPLRMEFKVPVRATLPSRRYQTCFRSTMVVTGRRSGEGLPLGMGRRSVSGNQRGARVRVDGVDRAVCCSRRLEEMAQISSPSSQTWIRDLVAGQVIVRQERCVWWG